MIRMSAILISAFWASTALSLSCVPQSGASMYVAAAESEDRFLPVVGQFTFPNDQVQREETLDANGQEDINAPKGVSFAATIAGHALSSRGFDAPVDLPVTIAIHCVGPWCGGVPNGSDVLALLRETDTGYVVDAHACGGSVMTLYEGNMAEADAFVACHKSGTCKDPFR